MKFQLLFFSSRGIGRLRAVFCIAFLIGAAAVAAKPAVDQVGLSLELPSRAASEELVHMKAFIVEATRDDPHPWTYLAGPGFEILSRCDSAMAESLATSILNDIPLQQEIVPPAYWAPLAIPMTFIQFDRKPESTAAALVPDSLREDKSDEFYWGRFGGGGYWLSGGITASDGDAVSSCENDEGVYIPSDSSNGRFEGVGLGFRLNQCVPALPDWYIAGINGRCGIYHVNPRVFKMILPAALWISKSNTEAAVKAARKSKTVSGFLPMEEFFRQRGQAGGYRSPVWMSEAALFVRWGFFEDHQRAFEMFVERARREPVTEAMFRECFGFGYAEMQSRLIRYLLDASDNPIALRLVHPWPPPSVDFEQRSATRTEVARILGDWERMEGDAIKAEHPDISRAYLEQAGKTLMKPYMKGDRDPRLLAVLGLYEHDVGADLQAQEFLAAAADAGVVRPSAYVELAQLRFDDAKAHPIGAGEKFSMQQTAGVLTPLFAARRQAPLMAGGYLLIAETWAHCAFKPTPGNLEAVREGVKLYPRNTELTYLAAAVHAQWGYKTEAAALIEEGVRFSQENMIKRFEQLQATLKKTN